MRAECLEKSLEEAIGEGEWVGKREVVVAVEGLGGVGERVACAGTTGELQRRARSALVCSVCTVYSDTQSG